MSSSSISLPQFSPTKPSSSSSFAHIPPFISLFLIFLLVFYPYQSPSLFHARLHPSIYSKPRNFDTYPFASVCSSQARNHFLTRFSRSTRPYGLAPTTKTLKQSSNRVLLSSLPTQVGDGLGHRTCLLNFELSLALALDLTYAHRVSQYGSLTRDDPNAVENLFAWGQNELKRHDILQQNCAQIQNVTDACEVPAQQIICNRVKSRNHGGRFNQIVMIPDQLLECYLQKGIDSRIVQQTCHPMVKMFMAAFDEPNTLFQMRPKLCFHQYLFTNFSQTASWFSDKYWMNANDRANKVSTMDPKRIHIALHVRRGDFFNYTNRVLIPDNTFVDLVARIKIALDEIINTNLPLTVHVYSEGVPKNSQRLKDNHDIASMHNVYVNEFGKHMPNNHWQRIIPNSLRFNSFYGVGRGWKSPDIKVETHIATDTILALHQMIAADVFIGSISGLSMQVVRNIGRGLILLPLHENEIMQHELLVPFDYARNAIPSFINETLLYQQLAHFARKNRLACSVW